MSRLAQFQFRLKNTQLIKSGYSKLGVDFDNSRSLLVAECVSIPMIILYPAIRSKTHEQ